jgi:hypothetical protein
VADAPDYPYTAKILHSDERMKRYSGAEQNERKLSRNLGGGGESARADIHHRRLQDEAEENMRLRRGRKRVAAKRK